MASLDAVALADQIVLIGLVTEDQAYEARVDAEDGSPEAFVRSLLRKGSLTSWQIEHLQKGDLSGFFYGGCKVLFHISQGTFARVYRGVRVADGEAVAIKVLRQRLASNPLVVAAFHREAEAGTKLRHPNIVEILKFGEQDSRYFIVMEYIEGSNLRDLLKLRNHIDLPSALPLMLDLARALQYSHEHGVTHRDIKGTNILIGNKGVAKLVDFGLAAVESEDRAGSGQRTVDYSALERTCGSPKGDPRSDIYFLGCVFYQMLTGFHPMPEVESQDRLAKMLKRSFSAIKPISQQRNAPDKKLCRIIEKMMKVDLSARYATMGEVVQGLDDYQAGVCSNSDEINALSSELDHLFFDPFEEPLDEPVNIHDAPTQEEDAITEDELPPPPPPPPPPAIAPARDVRLIIEEYETPVPVEDVFFPDDDEPVTFEEFEVKAFTPKRVLCVEAQAPIQDAFRKSLSEMGYRVFLIGDPERATERYREAPTDAVIFDADGFGAEGVNAFLDMQESAKKDGHDLTALVLLGPKQRALREKIPASRRTIILDKPIKMKQVQKALAQLMPAC